MGRKYKQLDYSDRKEIEKLNARRFSVREISKKIQVSPWTVSRELNKNGSKVISKTLTNKETFRFIYSASKAQKLRDSRRTINNSKKHDHFIKWINAQRPKKYTYNQLIMEYTKLYPYEFKPCVKTIYNWYYKGKLFCDVSYSPIKFKKVRIMHKYKRHISTRPIKNSYAEIGHYELDTVVSGNKKTCIVSLNERATNSYYICFVNGRTSLLVAKAIEKIIKKHELSIISITSDNGTEFNHQHLFEEKYKIQWYFCNTYSPFERGQNEWLNRDFRKYYPKGYVFTQNDVRGISKVEKLLIIHLR